MTHPATRSSSGVAVGSIPLAAAIGESKGRTSAWGQGCPSAGDWQHSGAEAEHPLLPHPDTKPRWGLMLGSALYQSICSSKGWLKSQPCCFGVSAMQHFSASAFIYLFPSNCWSHTVLTWPGTSFAHPSPRFPSLEKPSSPETAAQRCRRGPSHPLFLGAVCVCTHTFPPGSICILLHFKVPVLPPRKETNGVKEFTSQVSEAAGLSGFICC